MTVADFTTVGRIEFGLIVSLSFRLVRLEWRRLALLAVLFLWAPYELYAALYAFAFSHHAVAESVTVKVAILLSYLALLSTYNIGVSIALGGLLSRLDGASGRRLALRAFPVGALLSTIGNAPNLVALFTGTPTTWGAYVLLIAANSLVLFALNLVFGSAMAVSLQEGKGAGRAIVRAAQLSSGARWRLAPVMLAYQATFAIGYVLLLAVGASLNRGLAGHLGYAWIALTSLPMIAASALIYRELRRIKDGFSDEELSGIFD